jgi:hypothetical protein
MNRPEDIRHKARLEFIKSLQKECLDSRAELRAFRREVIASRFEIWLELSGPLSRERRAREHAYLKTLKRREEEHRNVNKLALKVLMAEEKVFVITKEVKKARGYKDLQMQMYHLSMAKNRDLRKAHDEYDSAIEKLQSAKEALEKRKYAFGVLTWNPEDPRLVQQAHVRFLQKMARDLGERAVE